MSSKILPLLLLVFCASTVQAARTWTSAEGGYTLEADVIAFNQTDAILKLDTGKLVSVRADELSAEDREYLQSKNLAEQLSKSLEKMQTWTSKRGVKIRARVLAFGRKDYTLTRQRGKVLINDQSFEDLDPLHQSLFLRILSELESTELKTKSDLTAWAKSIAGKPKSYTLEGVLMELESGDQIPVPFFMFADDDLKVLQPGWEAWSKSHEDESAQKRESLMVQTEAMQYQQQRQQENYQRQQIEYLRLNMLAAATGITSIWEVGLQPPPGVYGRRINVMVTARNSELASQMALSQHPGYQVYGVRRASR